MSEAMQVYLHDHYAGSTFAVELLETLQKNYPTYELGAFAASILIDVKQDREVLHSLIQKIGSSRSDLKDAGAWFAEKASRSKLKHDHPQNLGAFEALETLSLGILGKLALWEALQVITEVDSRVSGLDYATLIARARNQHSQVEQLRLKTARVTFQKSEDAS